MFGKKQQEGAAAAAVVPGSISSKPVMAKSAPIQHDGTHSYLDAHLETSSYNEAKSLLINELLDQVDFQALESLPADQKRTHVNEACDKIFPHIPIPLTK